MILPVDLKTNAYQIILERGCLHRAADHLDLDRRVLIVTDDGVPEQYAAAAAEQCAQPDILRIPQGEASKNFEQLQGILARMLELGFTRGDCVVAVGGGVVGDLAGFAASVYMRGVDFYNIPTTVLSMVDSSVGGKTAIDLNGIKNVVGSFYQPKKVLVDADTLATLPSRQISNGLAEAVKMALTSDRTLFELFETGDPPAEIDTVIERSLRIKSDVVVQDERERNLRKILNFGHTIGHGIESLADGLYHGECVALGMIPMCAPAVRQRLIPVLEKLALPTSYPLDEEAVYQALLHDKKTQGTKITVIRVEQVGSFRMESAAPESLKRALTLISKGAERA